MTRERERKRAKAGWYSRAHAQTVCLSTAMDHGAVSTTVTALRRHNCHCQTSISDPAAKTCLWRAVFSHRDSATTAICSVASSQTRVERSRRPCKYHHISKASHAYFDAYAHHDVFAMPLGGQIYWDMVEGCW